MNAFSLMKNFFYGILVLSLFFNALLIWRVTHKEDRAAIENQSISDESAEFPFLSKRIFAYHQNDILINFRPLRSALREYVESLPDMVGVYFEYLPTGNSIGVNEKFEVAIASLIKTPIVMVVYNQLEAGLVKKDDILTIREENLDPKFGTVWQRGAGTKLTLEEAIDLALIESDNTAANVLLSIAPEETVNDVFNSLDISSTKDGQLINISPKSYSSIFRSLYLSSFITRTSSNEILDILSRTNFHDEIPAGVPKNVKVAHKIGVFQMSNTHSDCGIVYVPQRPYLLCIMAQADREKSSEYISLISKMVYGYVASVKGKKD